MAQTDTTPRGADEPKVELMHVDPNPTLDQDANLAAAKGHIVQMRSELDNMGVFTAARYYKRIGFMCMIAAFSASLEGYQVNLNGSIVSNQGFYKTLFGQSATKSPPKFVSAWGGIQSAGQFFGQVFLQFATERLGRKWAFYIIWVMLMLSVVIETITYHWWQWLIAKLFSGLGVGMLQATLPVYIAEHSPTQLRGFFINAYTFWFVVGQIMAPVALREVKLVDPNEFRIPIYTQWAMLGVMLVIFVLLPESPWWLVAKNRTADASKVLRFTKGHLPGYDLDAELEIMSATLEAERVQAEANGQIGWLQCIKGTNGRRFLIAAWPKIQQQFVGLAIFNSYATYFFQLAGNKEPFTVTVILACVQLLSVILSALTTDTFGRRPTTVYGYAVTVASVLCLGIVGCFDYASPALGSLLIFFACLATFSTTSASALGYAYMAEIPQQRIRAQVAGLSLSVCNLWSIMFSFTTPLMIGVWQVKSAFLFAGTGAIVVVIGWFILPEVARRTPAEIDEMFEKGVPARKFKTFRTEVEDNMDERARLEGRA